MESLFSKTLNHTIPHLPISSRPPPSSISPKSHTLKPSFPKTLTLTLTLKSLPLLLKPAILSLTTAAAIFLSRHSLPSKATILHPLPPSQSETLKPSNQIMKLRSLLQLKIKHQNLPEAIDIVNQLILLDPYDQDLHLLKSNLHTYNGETEKARQGFEQILSANPFVVEAYHGLVMAASRSRDMNQLDVIVERVDEVMQRCVKEEDKRDLKLLVAQVWIIQGKFKEALKMYEEMEREEPRDFRPYLCQGIVYTLMRKMDEADKNFRQYRKLVPENHPYAQLFENSLSGINAVIKREDDNAKVSSLQR